MTSGTVELRLQAFPRMEQKPKLVAAVGLLIATVVLPWPVAAQERPRFVRSGAPRTVTLRAGSAITPSYVRPMPVPRDAVPRATITVTYSGFTPQAQAAFQFAVDIWASQIISPVPILIDAQFVPLGPGVLGAAGPWDYVYCTSSCAPAVANTWYPVALANKLVAADTLPGEPDIIAQFSSTFPSYYFGTNGAPPGGLYDFVSVVLHELGHGLGFSGLMQYSGGVGSWGFGSGLPSIYDRFTINGSGQSLINTSLFPNPSVALGAQLTSNNIYFDGPNTRPANGGLAGPLYAPATWAGGSSYSHWNEASFPPGHPNSLMTPFLNSAEAVHDPGNLTRAMFRDMGWSFGICAYSLSSTGFSTGAGATTSSVNVTTTVGCSWTAMSNSPALTITSGVTGAGPGTVNFSVAANVVTNTPTATRMPTLTIAGLTFTVTQTGCSYSLSPTSVFYEPAGGGGMVAIIAPAACTWTAASNSGFLTVTGGTPGSSNGTVT